MVSAKFWLFEKYLRLDKIEPIVLKIFGRLSQVIEKSNIIFFLRREMFLRFIIYCIDVYYCIVICHINPLHIFFFSNPLLSVILFKRCFIFSFETIIDKISN